MKTAIFLTGKQIGLLYGLAVSFSAYAEKNALEDLTEARELVEVLFKRGVEERGVSE